LEILRRGKRRPLPRTLISRKYGERERERGEREQHTKKTLPSPRICILQVNREERKWRF
jgi:hypothetical protein